ncbi:hypothetical protein GCK32_006605, partial [Trichostrongylus colubriformis]
INVIGEVHFLVQILDHWTPSHNLDTWMVKGLIHVIFIMKQILACEYVPPPADEVTLAITEYSQRPRTKRNPFWDWIRIETVYDPSFHLLSVEKKEVLKDLIVAARDYFETTIKVKRISSLQLQPRCKGPEGFIYKSSGTVVCPVDCQKRCGGAIAPFDAPFFSKSRLQRTVLLNPTNSKKLQHCFCSPHECATRQTNWGENHCSKRTLAYAGHCARDAATNRPVAGQVNICPYAFGKMTANDITKWQSTLKHELIHALVFSSDLFQYFPGAGLSRGGDLSVIPNVVHRYTRTNWETSKGPTTHDVFMVVTPKVREEARRHFNCSTLEGAEIESQGPGGTAGKAESMPWGRNLGCTFAKQSCLTWMKSNPKDPYPFCTVYEDTRCSTSRQEKVRCNMLTDSWPLPREYNYNIKNLYRDKKGRSVTGYGSVELADFCPYYRIYGNVSREDSDTRCTYPDNKHYNNYSLEVFSPTARCFDLDGGINVQSERGTITWLHSVGCYETICKDGRLMIKTQNSKFYPCYQNGQFIHVEKTLVFYRFSSVYMVLVLSQLGLSAHRAPSYVARNSVRRIIPDHWILSHNSDTWMVNRLLHVILIVKQILACDYVPPSHDEVTVALTEYPQHSRTKRNAVWDWVRIETVYDPSFQHLSEEKKKVVKDLIVAARDYFETTIKVQRISSLQLQPWCKVGGGRMFKSNGTVICADDCQKRCGQAFAPLDAPYFTHCFCSPHECPTRHTNWGGKLHNVDFILFVTVLGNHCSEQMRAYANHCARDAATNRPIAGHVNICPHAFGKMRAKDISTWQVTIKHELIHAFVFSSELFQHFPGAGPSKGGDLSVIPNVVHRYTRKNWETSEGPITHDVFMVVTPKVREEARRHFNCSTLEGAEIESQEECCSSKAESMPWGRNLGCTFAKQSCLTWMKSNTKDPYPFCTVYVDTRCSTSRKEKVRCNMLTDSRSLPREYNYNIKNLYHDKKGRSIIGYGSVELADFCPYYRIPSDIWTDVTGTRCTHHDYNHYNNYSLEVFSPTARCFDLDGGIRVRNERGIITWFHSAACYETICKNGTLMIKTQKSKVYPCHQERQFIDVEERVYGVGTVTTRIVCPPCSELCGRDSCAPDRVRRNRTSDPTRITVQPKTQMTGKVGRDLIGNPTRITVQPKTQMTYKPPSDDEVKVAITEYPRGPRRKREPLWDWIRIETEYDPSFNLLSERKKEVLEDLITAARDYFETTVKVQRLSSLQLKPTCSITGKWFKHNGTHICKGDCEKRCGGAIASTEAHFFAVRCFTLKFIGRPSKDTTVVLIAKPERIELKCQIRVELTTEYNVNSVINCEKRWCGCDFSRRIANSKSYYLGRLNNADFVLFVSVIGGRCGKQVIAYASHCATDPTTNRPVAGHVNICPDAFDNMKSNEFSQWEATIKHELIHAFVFSTSLFQMFPRAKPAVSEGPITVIPNVIERFTRIDWEGSRGPISHDVYMMVTPKVRKEARRHFNCSTLEGAEIENQGGSGTAGTHWEKRVFE